MHKCSAILLTMHSTHNEDDVLAPYSEGTGKAMPLSFLPLLLPLFLLLLLPGGSRDTGIGRDIESVEMAAEGLGYASRCSRRLEGERKGGRGREGER